MKFALAALLLTLAGCAGNPIAKAHSSTVLLAMDDGTCSGTVVGPHTVLTAEHCLVGAHRLAIDGNPVKVVSVTLDHSDHALVRVDRSFPAWAQVGGSPVYGEPVFVLGNPGVLRDMYRHGYVSGHHMLKGMDVTLYDLNGYYGDSGSGIFNDSGELVGVVSVMQQQVDGGYIKFMGSFALRFTAQEWESVQ